MVEKSRHTAETGPSKKYVEDVFGELSELEGGVPRVGVSRLAQGRDTRVKISAADSIEQQGFDIEDVLNSRAGSVLQHINGELFIVTQTKKDRVIVEDADGFEGHLMVKAKSVKAHEYTYRLTNQSGKSKKVSVFDMAFKDRSEETTELIDRLIQSLPASCLNVFDEIRIQKAAFKEGGKLISEPAIGSTKKHIILQVDPDIYSPDEIIKTFLHEVGHAIVRYYKGTANPGDKWYKAMQADGNQLSEYAEETRYPNQNDRGEIEDFAEAARLYLAADGANTNRTQKLREACESRFKMLDEVFLDLEQAQVNGIIGAVRRRFSRTSVLDK
jgi:hypothetical protein